MKKIPTVFVRNPDDRRHVLDEVTPGCEWVLAGEGRPTRKYDGTCVLVGHTGERLGIFTRREVKRDKELPSLFVVAEYDPVTGKTVGWEPYEQSSFAALIDEAIDGVGFVPAPGETNTYELCGPKINGNPEGYEQHRLIRHSAAMRLDVPDRSFEALQATFTGRDWPGWEGIVFHHPDGRMAKIKRRDFV